MKYQHDTTEIGLQRYAAWERSAGTAVACLAIAVAASLYVHVPSVLFIVGNVFGGVFIFLAWRMFIKGRTSGRLALAALLVAVCVLTAASTEIHQPRRVLLPQAFGLVVLTLFVCILAARRKAGSQ